MIHISFYNTGLPLPYNETDFKDAGADRWICSADSKAAERIGEEKSGKPQGLRSPADSNLSDRSLYDTYLFHNSSRPPLRLNNQ
jgi:hypothetical protein